MTECDRSGCDRTRDNDDHGITVTSPQCTRWFCSTRCLRKAQGVKQGRR